jgi:integrase
MAGLTVKGVEKILRDQTPGRYSDGGGLYLHVRPGGSWAWVFRYSINNKRRDLGLGSGFTLEQARSRASELLRAAKEGRDPEEQRDREKARLAVPTFKEAAIACHAEQAKGWSDKHAAAWLASLEQHAYPVLGKKRVDVIEPADVAAALRPIWLETPVIAKQVRQRIGAVLNYSFAHKWRAGEAPVKSVSILLSRQPKGGNFEAMSWEEVPAWADRVLAKEESLSRLALLFTVLTVARSKETRHSMISWVNYEKKEWDRPAGVMKRRLPHTVTLSDQAIEIAKRAEAHRTTKADGLLFPGKGGRPMSDMTMTAALRSSGERTATVHGFRSSFKDWAAEKMPHIPEAVSEACLSHAVPDATIAAYRRTQFNEMRRQLLDAWGAFVMGGGKVVRLSIAS